MVAEAVNSRGCKQGQGAHLVRVQKEAQARHCLARQGIEQAAGAAQPAGGLDIKLANEPLQDVTWQLRQRAPASPVSTIWSLTGSLAMQCICKASICARMHANDSSAQERLAQVKQAASQPAE